MSNNDFLTKLQNAPSFGPEPKYLSFGEWAKTGLDPELSQVKLVSKDGEELDLDKLYLLYKVYEATEVFEHIYGTKDKPTKAGMSEQLGNPISYFDGVTKGMSDKPKIEVMEIGGQWCKYCQASAVKGERLVHAPDCQWELAEKVRQKTLENLGFVQPEIDGV